MKFEYFTLYDGLSEEQINDMTAEDLESYAKYNKKRNAWAVAKEVQLRSDDEKGPANDFLKCYVTEQVEEQFFFNKDELLQYCSVSISKKHTVPGHVYFDEIFKFVRDHVEIGELYMEYKKGSCEIYTQNKCDYSAKAPKIIQCPILPVPRPYPDASRLPEYHYKNYKETPLVIEDGELRKPDNFQPRHQLRLLLEQGSISSDNKEELKEFSSKFVVSEKLVVEYVLHLEDLKLRRDKRTLQRKKQKQQECSLKYEDYNWRELFESNKLKTLNVPSLKKYLAKHNLQVPKTEKAIVEAPVYAKTNKD